MEIEDEEVVLELLVVVVEALVVLEALIVLEMATDVDVDVFVVVAVAVAVPDKFSDQRLLNHLGCFLPGIHW